jgi:hypothetical protein
MSGQPTLGPQVASSSRTWSPASTLRDEVLYPLDVNGNFKGRWAAADVVEVGEEVAAEHVDVDNEGAGREAVGAVVLDGFALTDGRRRAAGFEVGRQVDGG